MKKHVLILAGLLALLPSTAQAAVEVFACEPEWKALAEEIGGDAVHAVSATTAFADPHHIRAKPSLIAAIRRADLVICSGAGLEVGWLPILLQKSGNARLQPGQDGLLMAAEHVPLLEKPATLDRSMGDLHPEGNPHLHLNPHNIARVAEELSARLQRLSPTDAGFFRQRHADFSTRWTQAVRRWESRGAALAGKTVVVHHRAWTYLLDWLGMPSLASLEPKPGLPPTAAHLEAVLRQARTTQPHAILRTPYETAQASEWLAERSGAPALLLPYTVGGNDRASDLFGLFDDILSQLERASHAQR